MSIKRNEACVETSPLVWLAELWFARQSGDQDREATARRQLRSHGVDVLIDPRGSSASTSDPEQPGPQPPRREGAA